MIAAKQEMTADFAARIAYVLSAGHDRGPVLFAVADNLLSAPAAAAAEMQETWTSQPSLKRAAGVANAGRRCRNPVRHDVLSWAEDEHPDLAHMLAAARAYLAAIGMAEHEAVIVGHDHNGKRHVHIVANTVNPVTGKVADMTGDQWKAQAWCLAYEQAQGRVRCKHRTAPRIGRAFGAATGQPKSRQRLSRPEWERRQKLKEADRKARARHKADQWAKLTEGMKSSAANAGEKAEKQKASIPLAPRP